MVKIGFLNLGDFPLSLAPMEDVSDPPFRAVCKAFGADLMYSEFISSEGLIRNAYKSVKKLDIYPEERPIGIQIFGGRIDTMIEAGKIVEAVQPELIDINFGCPVKKVVAKGGGAAILQDLPKMQKLAEAVVKNVSLPVTVKTRLGWDHHSIRIVEVTKRLQDVGVQAITIHARTRKQMYKGEADWSYLGEIKNNAEIHIPIFGNGDIDSPQKALAYKKSYGIDGIMIGRAAIGNPWIFNQIKSYLKDEKTILKEPSLKQKVQMVIKHLDFSVKWKGEKLGILEMRRHYSNYFKGIPNFKNTRMKLLEMDMYEPLVATIKKIPKIYGSSTET